MIQQNLFCYIYHWDSVAHIYIWGRAYYMLYRKIIVELYKLASSICFKSCRVLWATPDLLVFPESNLCFFFFFYINFDQKLVLNQRKNLQPKKFTLNVKRTNFQSTSNTQKNVDLEMWEWNTKQLQTKHNIVRKTINLKSLNQVVWTNKYCSHKTYHKWTKTPMSRTQSC